MKFVNVLAGVWQIVAKYPAISAGLANVLVVVGAAVGLNFTTAQLATTASIVAAMFSLLVHEGVIPLNKARQGQVPADVKLAVAQRINVEAQTQPIPKFNGPKHAA